MPKTLRNILVHPSVRSQTEMRQDVPETLCNTLAHQRGRPCFRAPAVRSRGGSARRFLLPPATPSARAEEQWDRQWLGLGAGLRNIHSGQMYRGLNNQWKITPESQNRNLYACPLVFWKSHGVSIWRSDALMKCLHTNLMQNGAELLLQYC